MQWGSREYQSAQSTGSTEYLTVHFIYSSEGAEMIIQEFTKCDGDIMLSYLQFAIGFLQKICVGQTDGTEEERRTGTLLFGLESAQSYFVARGYGPVKANDQAHFACAFVVANILLLIKQRQPQEFLRAIEELGRTAGEVNTNSSQVVELLSRLQNPT